MAEKCCQCVIIACIPGCPQSLLFSRLHVTPSKIASERWRDRDGATEERRKRVGRKEKRLREIEREKEMRQEGGKRREKKGKRKRECSGI